MKRFYKITAIAVVSVGILAGGAAFAGKKYMGGSKNADHMVSFVAGKLDLDTTQKQALSVFADQVLVAKDTMRGQMQTTKDDARSLLKAETFDQGKALAMVNAKTATVDSLAPELITSLGNFMDTLNEEQKEEILDFIERGHDKHRRGHWKH